MKANAIKLSLVLGVAALLIGPSLIAAPASSGNSPKVIPVNCSVVKPNGSPLAAQAMITVKEAKELSRECNDAAQAFKVLYTNSSSSSDKEKAKEIIENTVDMMVKLGILPAEYTSYVASMLLWPFSPSHGIDIFTPIVSVGQGISWIPLYPGEAFLGIMLRPIFVMYPLMGYTASLSVVLMPPRIQYWDLVGPQMFMAWGFAGIYIDFGKIGLGVPNTNFMLGYSIATAGISLL